MATVIYRLKYGLGYFTCAEVMSKQSPLSSALREAAVKDLYRHKMARKSFGLPRGPLPDPHHFLRKGDKLNLAEKKFSEASSKSCTGARKPPVPRRGDNLIKFRKVDLNYVLWNKINSRSMATPPFKQRLVDNKDGHTIDIPTSGLVPRHTLKPTFGKVPSYLVKKEQESQLKNESSATDLAQNTIPAHKECPSPRSQTLQELKQRWVSLETQLQRVSFGRPDKRVAIEDDIMLIESRIKRLLSH